MSNNLFLLSLVATTCEQAVSDCSGGPKEKLISAFRAAKNHWMVTDQHQQMLGAVAAVMTYYGVDSPEYEQLSKEMKKLAQLSAFFEASQVGLSVEFPTLDDDFKPLRITGLWQQVLKERK
jgi:hypothetical protein